METNGTKVAAPGPAETGGLPDDLTPSPTWRGLPVDKTSEAILVAILRESEEQTKTLGRIEQSFLAIANAVEGIGSNPMLGALSGMFGKQ